MTRANICRILIILLLVSGLASLRAHAQDCGCTACVQTDDGYWGCWVDHGCAALCAASNDGKVCLNGGDARKDGCIGSFIQ